MTRVRSGEPFRAARGRGKHYGPVRARYEQMLERLWRGGWGARLWARVPGALDVSRVQHTRNFGRRARPPLRVAFLSDLHIGPTTPIALLERAVELANAFRPELVLLGGDYVFLEASAGKLRDLERLVGALRAESKIAVLGNHDLWTDHEAIARALELAGARVCVNEAVRLRAPHDDVVVFGLDEPWTGDADATHSESACEGATLRLALAHSPDGVVALAGHGFQLLFSGHTHGGHVALPGGRPLLVPPGPYSKKLPWGLHQVGTLEVFVSRGLGATELPVRLFAPPDVGLFTIT